MTEEPIESGNVDEPDVTPDLDPVQGLEQGAGFSLIDVFQEELKELADAESVMIPVKGYERTGLQVKYHMPDHGKQLDDVARRVAREYKDQYSRNLYAAMDTMILLCDGIYVQPEGVEEPVELDPHETGMPCHFDETLAEMMGMNGTGGTARTVVKRLFGGNEMAILGHAERLSRWLQNTKADVESEIWQLGE